MSDGSGSHSFICSKEESILGNMSIALLPNTIPLSNEMSSTVLCDPVIEDSAPNLSRMDFMLVYRMKNTTQDEERSHSLGNEIPPSDSKSTASLSSLQPRQYSAVELSELVKDDNPNTMGYELKKSDTRPMSLKVSRVIPSKAIETAPNLDHDQSNSPMTGSTPSTSPSRALTVAPIMLASSNVPLQDDTDAVEGAESSLTLEAKSSKKERSRSLGNDIATSDLQFIAAELSSLKPRQYSAVEEAELVKDDHQITLGTLPNESTGTNKSHRRPMSLNLSRVLPPKPLETAANLDRGTSNSPATRSSPSASPSRAMIRTSSIPSLKLATNDITSSKSSDVLKTPLRISTGPGAFNDDTIVMEKTKTSSVLEIRSSEQEPSVHQTNIPTLQDFLFPAHLCSMLDNYRQIDQNFDFQCLTGMNRADIETILGQTMHISGADSSTFTNKVDSSEKVDAQRMKWNLSHQQITQLHKPILENFLKYSKDLVLEGFYHELALEEPKRNGSYDSAREKSTQDRMEAAIFSSDCSRQFLVVFQGSVDMQAKTIWNHNDQKVKGCPQESLLCDEQPVTVFAPFRNAYFNKSNLEEKIFRKLDELIQSHPFFDVVMTGFSFGGVLASIASMRYASTNPMLLVSCFTYGCPKIGALNYRHSVNSLPNLKVMRLECKNDPRSFFPDNPVWSHAGHSIVIDVVVPISLSLDASKEESIKGYKFGQHRPPMSVVKKVGSAKFFSFLRNHAMKDLERNEYNIATYILALQRMAILGLPWPSDYVGEDCCGVVSGIDDEKRLVV